MLYSVEKEYKELEQDAKQPRRSLYALKKVAEEEVTKEGLKGKVKVVITKNFRDADARASFQPIVNRLKLHPINKFATEGDVRQVVRHELRHYEDTIKGVEKKRGKYCRSGKMPKTYFCNRCKEWHGKGDKNYLKHLGLKPL